MPGAGAVSQPDRCRLTCSLDSCTRTQPSSRERQHHPRHPLRRPHADRPVSRRPVRLYRARSSARSPSARRSRAPASTPAAVDEVIMGQVVQGGSGQAPARQALIHAGLPGDDPRAHHQQGLRLRPQGRDARRAGDQGGRRARCVVAGGQESMSSAPHYVYGMRNGDQGRQPDDGGRHDPRRALGLVRLLPHGRVRRVHRREGRRDAARSRTRSPSRATGRRSPRSRPASSRPRSSRWRSRARAGRPPSSADEGAAQGHHAPRRSRKLKPAFQKDGGTVTAGNAPGLNDGASALVVTSLAFAEGARAHADGADHRRTPPAAASRRRSVLRADPRGAEPDGEDRHHDRRLRPDRGERGVRVAGARRRPRARLGLGPGQRATAARSRWATRSARAARAC